MVEVREVRKTDVDAWNEIVEKSPDAWVFHLFEWQEVLKFFGLKSNYLVAEENGRVIGIYPLVIFNKYGITFIDSVGVGACGPATVISEKKEAIRNAFMLEVDELASRIGALFSVIRLPTPALANLQSKNEVGWYVSYGYQTYPTYTFIISLEKDLVELLKNLRKDTRKKLRKLEKNNLKIFEKNNEMGVEELYRLHLDLCNRTGLKKESIDYFKTIWHLLSPKGIPNILLAEYKNEVVGALLTFTYKDVTLPWAVPTATRYQYLNLGYSLHWHSIKLSKERGMKWFDFCGVQPYVVDPRDVRSRTNYQFKSGWGGTLIEEKRGLKVYKPIKKKLIELGIHSYNYYAPSFIKRIVGRERVALFALL